MITDNPPITITPGERLATQAQTRHAQERQLRLSASIVLSVAALLFIAGTAWDIQWHVTIGRDRAFTVPHIVLLTGLGVAGLGSLFMILWETRRSKHNPQMVNASNSTRMLRIFRAPLGFAITGLGALFGMIAFPLDDYWHTLYGIDVTLWAPFHVMIISSMLMVLLGVLFVVAGELNHTPAGRGRLWTQIGCALVMALFLITLLIFITQTDGAEGLVQIGSYSFVWYPVFLAGTLPLGLLTTLLITRQPGMATVTALGFLWVRQVLFAFVPWATTAMVQNEGLTYRLNAPTYVIMAVALPGSILLAALLLDGGYWLIQRRHAPVVPWLVGISVGAVLLTTLLDRPWATILPYFYYPAMDVDAVFVAALPLAVGGALLGSGAAVLFSRALRAVRR